MDIEHLLQFDIPDGVSTICIGGKIYTKEELEKFVQRKKRKKRKKERSSKRKSTYKKKMKKKSSQLIFRLTPSTPV